MAFLDTIRLHFARYRQRSKWDFLWWISLEGLLVSTAAAVLLHVFLKLGPRQNLPTGVRGLIEVVVFAPFFETLLLQGLPVMIARALGSDFRGQLLAAWLPFAALHFQAGPRTGICAGVIGGFYIAFTYAHWRQTTFRMAFWMTSASHAIHNLLPGLLLLAKSSP